MIMLVCPLLAIVVAHHGSCIIVAAHIPTATAMPIVGLQTSIGSLPLTITVFMLRRSRWKPKEKRIVTMNNKCKNEILLERRSLALRL
jgi:hypothetical protein